MYNAESILTAWQIQLNDQGRNSWRHRLYRGGIDAIAGAASAAGYDERCGRVSSATEAPPPESDTTTATSDFNFMKFKKFREEIMNLPVPGISQLVMWCFLTEKHKESK